MKEGFGVYQWPDGKKYEGPWSKGKQHGIGFYTNTSGVRREAEFMLGKKIRWVE